MRSLTLLNQVDIKLAVPEVLSVLDPYGDSSMNKLLLFVQSMEGSEVSLIIRPKRTRKSEPRLKRSGVLDFTNKLVEIYGTYIKRCKVRGKIHTDGENDVADFLEQWLVSQEVIKSDGNFTSYDYFKAIRQAYNKRENDVIDQFETHLSD